MLSLTHVIEWRGAVTPDRVAGLANLSYSLFTGGHLHVLGGPQRLAGFKCPAGVTVAGQPPGNATGKVLKPVLREPHWAGRDRQVS